MSQLRIMAARRVWFLILMICTLSICSIASDRSHQHETRQSRRRRRRSADNGNRRHDQRQHSAKNGLDEISTLFDRLSEDSPDLDSTNTSNWIEQMGNDLQIFLRNNVFGQNDVDSRSDSFLSHVTSTHPEGDSADASAQHGNIRSGDDASSAADSTESTSPNWLDAFIEGISHTDDAHDNDHAQVRDEEKESFLEGLTTISQQWKESSTKIPTIDAIKAVFSALDDVLKQLDRTFGKVFEGFDSFPLAVVYFLAYEDSQKNVSWKRRQHLWYDQVPRNVMVELHDALYLSQLAYVDSLQVFADGLRRFHNNSWQLVYGSTESRPNYPANFLLVHKQMAPMHEKKPRHHADAMQSIMPWESKPWLEYEEDADSNGRSNEIEVVLVVRGTKELTDVLSDGMLEPVPYRDGFAHGGILQGGLELAEEHLPKLRQLLEHSGRERIKLYIVGHSLGAGAGTIAAMEFNEYDFITVEAVGFGCPALLSPELSESVKDYVETIVADSDIVPRMSGATLVNVLLDMMKLEWKEQFHADLEFYVARAKQMSPLAKLVPKADDLKKWFEALIADKSDHPIRQIADSGKHADAHTRHSAGIQRTEPVLIPPGSCIHMYRDGVGYTAAYTPCDFFNQVDVSRTAVDDHMIMTGYHRAMVTWVRDQDQNFMVGVSPM
uniref:Fungal lipase-type domain-containing protein n=1 Tax=Craspedostauros australis TaxID=1486917 RepID=A0A7R9WSI3_9STRA|mmetsp:Transcript_18833/g.52342  ORF Transcript_18833/g.52342 Transcript_18833/m.52342 type:complete len:665 (+) Transcript_18833:266-2260(+)